MREIILITVSGKDQTGVTAVVSQLLAQYHVNVLDIGQASIHEALSLGILAEVPSDSAPLRKDILFKLHELGLHVSFESVEESRYSDWVAAQGKPRHIISLLARKVTAEHIARVSSVLAQSQLNIDKITRLSGRIPLGELPPSSKACVEFSARGELQDTAAVRSRLLDLASELDVDIAYQEDTVYRRNRRLVAFDMDSTLIDAEVIDELAKAAGVGDQVVAITESAMRGELDFSESFRQRLRLLRGLDESVLASIADSLRLSEGAERLVSTIRRLGYKTAILSGGFDYFGRYLQDRLGIDYVYANQLDICDGKLTGEVVGQIVDGQRKAELLQEIADREGLCLEQVIAVGDGANDLPMLSLAGLGIAFRAKPLVKESAKHSISTLGLDGILYLMGYSDRETEA